MSDMAKLSAFDAAVFAAKQRSRDADATKVAAGEATWAEMNRANFFAASVIHLYTPMKKLGLPRGEKA